MTSTSKSSLLAVVLTAITTISASAQLMSYSTKDVIVAFRSTSNADVAVNIGSIDALITQAGGTSVDLTSFVTIGGVNQLTQNFGSNLSTVAGLSYSAFASGGPSAGTAGGSAIPANTTWQTFRRTDPDVQSVGYLDVSTSTASSYKSRTEGVIGQGSTSGIIKFDGAASDDLAIIPKANQNSYSTKRSAGTPSFGTTFPSNEGTFGAFTLSRIDLYQIEGTSASPKPGSEFLGYLTLSSSGNLSFTAVPEPQEYAMMFGGLLIVGAAVRRRFSGQKQN